MESTIYLIGSPTEHGTDVYAENAQTYLNAGNVAVYGEIKSPSTEMQGFVGSFVSFRPHPGSGEENFYVSKSIQDEMAEAAPFYFAES